MKESFYKWLLGGIGTLLIVVGGLIVDKISKLDNDIMMVYIRQAALNQKVEDESLYKELKKEVDSLKIIIHTLKP